MSDLRRCASPSQSAFSRRTLLGGLAGATALAALGPLAGAAWAAQRKGRIKQSACLWCYDAYRKREKMDLDQFATACSAMGLVAMDLVAPDQWTTLQKHGLICSMTPSHDIKKGLNRVENHEACLAKIHKAIDDTSAASFPNVICFSGNRDGMDDQEGLKNCVTALKSIAPYAEQKKVTICLEFLNATDHKDYMADSTKWCVELVHGVDSPRVKVLYDIYHAAMMKEDVLADIQAHADCWGHYHTGGMPGRHEIDDTQTLDYPKLMRAIVATGFSGYVGQEFVPKKPEALESLEQAVTRCDV
jgi:hydroxypyruvate isomerase